MQHTIPGKQLRWLIKLETWKIVTIDKTFFFAALNEVTPRFHTTAHVFHAYYCTSTESFMNMKWIMLHKPAFEIRTSTYLSVTPMCYSSKCNKMQRKATDEQVSWLITLATRKMVKTDQAFLFTALNKLFHRCHNIHSFISCQHKLKRIWNWAYCSNWPSSSEQQFK